MTNNEAAKWIQLYIDLANIDPTTGEEAYLNEDARKTLEAMSMAVDALIDKQAAADRIIDGLPSAQPEIVRCKDCKNSLHWYRDRRRCFLWSEDGVSVFDDGFCSYAERRTDE